MAAKSKRALAIVLAVIASGALVTGAVTDKWLAGTIDDDTAIGLRGARVCLDHDCGAGTNFEVVEAVEAYIQHIVEYNAHVSEQQMRVVPRDPWHGWPVMGWIAFVTSLVTAAGLMVGAAFAIAGRRLDWAVMPTSVAVLGLIGAIITGCVFVATKPDAIDLVGVGWSFLVFGGGVVLGLAAVFPLNRQLRPIDEDLGPSSATMSWGASRDD